MPFKALALIICFFGLTSLSAQNTTRVEYINRYKAIAISEMERSGIPASITLAQGILESGNGNSTLATKANNHFGIKCHKGWVGKSYYIEDDDRDARGNLIKSCFRVYSDPYESYIDHTEFLVGRSRYSFLFDYEQTEFKKWARGLKQAGYATNPKYPDLLIKIITENNLDRFDSPGNTDEADLAVNYPIKEIPPIVVDTPIKSQPNKPKEVEKPKKSLYPKKNTKNAFYNNDVKAIVAQRGDRSLALATEHKVPYHQFIKYNDLNPGDEIEEGQYVYLKPKRVNFRGRKKRHSVKEGENMYVIAQLYGLRLKALYRKNKMEKPEEPAVNENLAIRGKLKNKPRLASKRRKAPASKTSSTKPIVKTTPKKDELPVVFSKPPVKKTTVATTSTKTNTSSKPSSQVVIKPTKASSGKPATTTSKPKPETPVVAKAQKPLSSSEIGSTPDFVVPSSPVVKRKIHTVVKGDTLYSISKRYNVSIGQIKDRNGLETNVININQKLIVD